MSSLVKLAFGDSVGQLMCCMSPPSDGKTTGASKLGKLSREDYRRHLQALEEEKKKRDEDFAQRKVERAAMRSHMRQKYQLGQNEKDAQQLKAVKGRVHLAEDLATIVNVGRTPGTAPRLLGALPGLPETNLTELTNTAQAAINQLRQTTERQCALM